MSYDGDRKRDRDRKSRAYVQGEADEWDRERLERNRNCRCLGTSVVGMSLQLGKLKMTARKRVSQTNTNRGFHVGRNSVV